VNKLSVFSQIIKLIPRSYFQSAVHFYGADKNVKALDSWTWFGALIFSQLSGHDSIRTLQKVFSVDSQQMRRLGFKPFCRSTFSDANGSRPSALVEDIFRYVLTFVKPVKMPAEFKQINFPVYLLDSTFIDLCLSLCPWAHYRKNPHSGRPDAAGVKAHIAIDLAGHIPEFVVVKAGTEKTNHDLKVAREQIGFAAGTLVVFDRGYWSLEYLNELNQSQISFVTRPKLKKMSFRVAESRAVDKSTGLRCDQTVYFNSQHTKGLYKGPLRRISYYDPDTKKRFVFVTNRFDLPAKTICDLYKARWQVELFFRTLKQHLKIKKFVGLNENAVKSQVYAALICYVLMKYLRQVSGSSFSMPEVMAVVRTLILMKFNIIELLQNEPRTTRHPPPDPRQLDLFISAQ